MHERLPRTELAEAYASIAQVEHPHAVQCKRRTACYGCAEGRDGRDDHLRPQLAIKGEWYAIARLGRAIVIEQHL